MTWTFGVQQHIKVIIENVISVYTNIFVANEIKS